MKEMNKNDKAGEKNKVTIEREYEITMKEREYEITMKYRVSTSSNPTTIVVTLKGESEEELITMDDLAVFLDNMIQRILKRKYRGGKNEAAGQNS